MPEHQCLHDDDVKEIKEDVKAILTIINGNGKIGLAAKVTILWSVSLFMIAGIITALIR